jgi:hypothetical protein
MSIGFRAYFFDTNGVELSKHPLNGMTWCQTFGSPKINGTFCHTRRTGVRIARYADLKGTKGEVTLTPANVREYFGNVERVGVKVWYSPESSEKFWIYADPETKA